MQLLGRATSIGAYVKRGEESGYIKICLRGERKEDPITITRKIDTRNKSEWLFNGKVLSCYLSSDHGLLYNNVHANHLYFQKMGFSVNLHAISPRFKLNLKPIHVSSIYLYQMHSETNIYGEVDDILVNILKLNI